MRPLTILDIAFLETPSVSTNLVLVIPAAAARSSSRAVTCPLTVPLSWPLAELAALEHGLLVYFLPGYIILFPISHNNQEALPVYDTMQMIS
ncbi:MAG: hypothetical protein GY805_31450 [Chloroflexi bacterium]|nr:hypothetical protein [Chloroflexota bacterium]